MRAYGSDRLRVSGETLVLRCRRSKGWTPRSDRTTTSAEHPGTAVEWDERWFEVLRAAQLEVGVEYVLVPWSDHHVMRVTSRYDDAAEQEREAAHQKELQRSRRRKQTNLLGLFAGHLPGPVQNHLGNELGVSPMRLSFLSLILPYLLFVVCVLDAVDARIQERLPLIPGVVFLVAALMFFESGIRTFVLLSQSRPVGSVAGLLAYALYHALDPKRGERPGPLAGARGDGLFTLPPSEEQARYDSLTLKAPLLTLLSPGEQRDLAARLGYEYLRDARIVAWVILIAALAGTLTSLLRIRAEASLGAFLSMLVATALAGEQAYRLVRFGRGPVGSVLGVLVRPLVRNLLEQR
jgi:hypothetical protein